MARGEGVKRLGSLFAKYQKTLKAPQASVVKVFCEVAEEVVGLKIAPKQVVYKTHTKLLSLVGGGPVRSELLLHKAEVLAHLKGRLGESAPKDII